MSSSWIRVPRARQAAALSCAISLSLSLPALAFKPTKEFGHVGITRDAASQVSYGGYSFSQRAIQELRDADASVDDLGLGGGFWDGSNHCDDELLPACTQRLIDLREAAVEVLLGSHDGTTAHIIVGQALHTLQDFYAHSNWVNIPGPGNFGAFQALGRTTVPNLPIGAETCIDDFGDGSLVSAGLTSITTGYFGKIEPPSGKCAHGVIPDEDVGINKDAPGRIFHERARASAVAGTVDYLNQIVDGIKDDDDALRAFFGDKTTIGFVIDDTGSMGAEIAGVAASVQQIIAANAGTERPLEYMVERFNDPNVGSPVINDDPSIILAVIQAIRPDGGGDCPEMSQTGLLRAIQGAKRGSTLYLYSDARAKDSYLAPMVDAAATDKKITINYALTGSCSPIDQAYLSVAQSTGGQAFIISPYETEKLFHLIEPGLAGDLEPILIVNDVLDATIPKSYIVPVDSSVRALTIAVHADSLSAVDVYRPDGSTAAQDATNIEETTMRDGRIFNVAAPMPGAWTVVPHGGGNLRLSVHGNTPEEISDFAFVEMRGRPEHEGYFPVSGLPEVGVAVTGRARVSAEPWEFHAVGLGGDELATLPLVSDGAAGTPPDEFVGEFTPPAQPFRISAHRRSSSGEEVQRVYPRVFSMQDLRVDAVAASPVAPGESGVVTFSVTNLGQERTVSLSVNDDLGYAGIAGASTLSLTAGESASVIVSLTVPSDATASQDVVMLVAVDTSDMSKRNFSKASVKIADPDTDDDGVPDDEDQCPLSDTRVTINVSDCDTHIENRQLDAGCTMADLIEGLRQGARNHGQFVASVAQFSQEQRDAGLITGRAMGAIQACAAHSK